MTEENTNPPKEKDNEKKTSNQPTQNKEKAISAKTRWVIALVMVLLLGGITIYFIINEQQWNKIISRFSSTEEVSENPPPKETADNKNEANTNDASADNGNNDLPVDVEQEGLHSGDIMNDEEITTPDEVDKWGVMRPSYIISHSAYTKEKSARQVRRDLIDEGFNSSYYYIPDYENNGKELYRVLVGPFTSRESAESQLKAVKKNQKSAYIMKLESEK